MSYLETYLVLLPVPHYSSWFWPWTLWGGYFYALLVVLLYNVTSPLTRFPTSWIPVFRCLGGFYQCILVCTPWPSIVGKFPLISDLPMYYFLCVFSFYYFACSWSLLWWEVILPYCRPTHFLYKDTATPGIKPSYTSTKRGEIKIW